MISTVTTLQQLLFELSGILPTDTYPLFSMMRPVVLEAHEMYIREGDTTKKIAFIEQGIMRAYTHKSNGDDVTLFVRWEGQFIASHDTIIHKKPARFTYRALEHTKLFEMDYDVLEQVLKEHPEYEPLRNFFTMKMLAESLEIMENFVLLSPEEHYLKLVSDKFDIVNRVPDKYIASMLGITPVSLSRIRRRTTNKPH